MRVPCAHPLPITFNELIVLVSDSLPSGEAGELRLGLVFLPPYPSGPSLRNEKSRGTVLTFNWITKK
jgi:hypothetical protein